LNYLLNMHFGPLSQLGWWLRVRWGSWPSSSTGEEHDVEGVERAMVEDGAAKEEEQRVHHREDNVA
jgi:hypothetical protein